MDVNEASAAAEDAPRPAAALYRARLDHDGIYWGVEAVEALGEADVPVPPDCDLKPGAYRLEVRNGHRSLWPLAPAQVKAEESSPTLEEAFHAVLTAGPEAPRVKAWLAWFEKSMDGRKA